ncbi:uncharacterized protein LOC111787938 [Cucurbita pepo subsp. pepo]|uniref:uncharacterized protein LOC111787938 n=1 Tax=Cucurbita pepo subsp. pepo TaxID=3664 RepID=UPI000C9D684D|nr:uncharacterized protein LOC111787938 [Cucurbita pepo subsp. pepo]
MEDEEQKMEALKKAYADIILNTVKEAATRVLVSEREARYLQQDLSSFKDESLRLLLRLKNMVDSKMREAEITSLCQRRKVEELEAKLHEAEDVITDLRIQLKEAQFQLEKEKKDKMQPLEGMIMNKITLSSQSILEPDSSCPSSSELQTVSSNLRNTKMEKIAHAVHDSVPKSVEHSSVSQVDIVHAHDSDSSSMVVRTKERRSYGKRCTQRIRALERNYLDYSLPLGIDVKDNQVLEEKEPLVKKKAKEEGGLSTRIGKTDIGKRVHGAVLKRSVKLHTLRRTSQFGKCKTGSCRLHGSQLTKPHYPSCIISLCRPYLKDDDVRSDNNEYSAPSLMADSGNVGKKSCLPEEHKTDSYSGASGNSNGRQPQGNMKRGNLNGHSPDQPIISCDKCFFLSPCTTSTNLVNDNGKSGDDHSKTKHRSKMKKLTCLDPGLTSSGSYVDSTSVPASVTASVKVNSSEVLENAANSKKELMALTVKQESDEIRNLICPSFKLNSEINPNTKYGQICVDTNCSPCQVDKKHLNCTRQSKRKREAMGISDENISPEKRNGKRSLGEKLKFEPQFERTDLNRESTRESRQLSEVARQLISLSRERW